MTAERHVDPFHAESPCQEGEVSLEGRPDRADPGVRALRLGGPRLNRVVHPEPDALTFMDFGPHSARYH